MPCGQEFSHQCRAPYTSSGYSMLTLAHDARNRRAEREEVCNYCKAGLLNYTDTNNLLKDIDKNVNITKKLVRSLNKFSIDKELNTEVLLELKKIEEEMILENELKQLEDEMMLSGGGCVGSKCVNVGTRLSKRKSIKKSKRRLIKSAPAILDMYTAPLKQQMQIRKINEARKVLESRLMSIQSAQNEQMRTKKYK